MLAGACSAALAWSDELDAMLNPELLHVAPAAGATPGAPVKVTPAMAQALYDLLAHNPSYGKPAHLAFPEREGDVAVASYRAGKGDHSASRQVMVDPVRLQVMGERKVNQVGLSRPLLMPTLLQLTRAVLAIETGDSATQALNRSVNEKHIEVADAVTAAQARFPSARI
jgi:hypothetical protein